ncbi:ATP-binding protein, partial [Acidobacteriota bacterium]
NMPPGDYVFRIKASNNDGVWNETGKSVKIKILPPWYQTWWARIFAFLFVVGLILSLYNARTNRLRTRSKELHEINKTLNREILERKMLEKKLVRQERLAVLGELAGGIAHELRNPLGAIKNSVYFLNMMLGDAEGEMKESLQILDDEIENAEGIISSLLDYARNKSPVKRRIPIAGIIDDLLSHLNIPENITVNNRVDNSLPEIMADRVQLNRAFGNIILNAVQAMPEGGQMAIRGDIENSGLISISVRNTGMGITEENIKKIFEPLFSTKAKGIGLGMSIAKTFLKGHGGTIEVQSVPGKGTTVTVKLPVRTTEGGNSEKQIPA